MDKWGVVMNKIKLNIQLFAAKTKETTFSENNISIENNASDLKITIKFSATSSETWFASKPLSCTCNGKTQTANVSLSKGGSVNKSFTFKDIKHNNDGTKTVAWSWSITTGTSGLGTLSDSGTKKLTTISRASSIDGVTFNSDDVSEESIINIFKYINNIYHTLKINAYIGTNEYIIATRDDTDLQLTIGENNYNFTFTSSELNYLYSLFPNTADIFISVELYTFIDSEKTSQLGDESRYYFNTKIAGSSPTFTDFDFSDVNQNTLRLTNDSCNR